MKLKSKPKRKVTKMRVKISKFPKYKDNRKKSMKLVLLFEKTNNTYKLLPSQLRGKERKTQKLKWNETGASLQILKGQERECYIRTTLHL